MEISTANVIEALGNMPLADYVKLYNDYHNQLVDEKEDEFYRKMGTLNEYLQSIGYTPAEIVRKTSHPGFSPDERYFYEEEGLIKSMSSKITQKERVKELAEHIIEYKDAYLDRLYLDIKLREALECKETDNLLELAEARLAMEESKGVNADEELVRILEDYKILKRKALMQGEN